MDFSMYHACVSVADLDKSIDFYEKALGLKVMKRTDDPDGEFRLAYLSADGQESGQCQLEVIWNRDKTGSYDLGDNETHIGFRTDDYETALAFHKKMGCFHHENKKYKLYFITDPDGYFIEILG